VRCILYALYGSDTFTAGQGNIDRLILVKNCCIILTVMISAAVALCIASCADPGSLDIGVNAFTLYRCHMFKQQYHLHLLVVTQQPVYNIVFIATYSMSDSGAISRLSYT